MSQDIYEQRSPLILEELDPSPIDESEADSGKDYFTPKPPVRSSTFGLYTAYGTPYYCIVSRSLQTTVHARY